jgi:membrane-associated protease RseP (regulator of RpoE activity)
VREEYLVAADPVENPSIVSKPRSTLTLRRVALHVLLLILTLGSTFFAASLFFLRAPSFGEALSDPRFLSGGLAYSLTLLSILLAHEMGHYLACRYYGIDATLPYFLPTPVSVNFPILLGTFGAFIRIREPIRSRRALFDIGIAGPLAGFAVAVPAALVGLWIAEPAPPIAPGSGVIEFKDPLLFILFQRLFDLPRLMEWNPIYFAAWVGMLATSLNLLPVGQLDGGHVVYALLGRRGHQVVALTMFVSICVLAVVAYTRHQSPVWFVYVGILGLMLGLKHPPVADEHKPIDRTRLLVGLIGLLVFILSFMPFPITFS